MAGKLIILCFLLAVVTIATCKPRNPFAGLSQRGRSYFKRHHMLRLKRIKL